MTLSELHVRNAQFGTTPTEPRPNDQRLPGLAAIEKSLSIAKCDPNGPCSLSARIAVECKPCCGELDVDAIDSTAGNVAIPTIDIRVYASVFCRTLVIRRAGVRHTPVEVASIGGTSIRITCVRWCTDVGGRARVGHATIALITVLCVRHATSIRSGTDVAALTRVRRAVVCHCTLVRIASIYPRARIGSPATVTAGAVCNGLAAASDKHRRCCDSGQCSHKPATGHWCVADFAFTLVR